MAFIHIRERSVSNWTPASYASNETANILPAHVGEVIIGAFIRVRTAFDGTNGDATISVGDDGDVDRFITTANSAITATGLKKGTGAGLTETPGYLYTTANTIDITFVADTGGDGAAGSVDVWVWYAKADPH